jgi:hypothetical protein
MRLPRIGDSIAIPFFLWLAIYFARKSKKQNLTNEEKLLFFFCAGGFAADIIFILFYSD